MKFLADGMLGKLTRWLRMLGHDVLYSTQFNDTELLKLAKEEERVLLTKDFELYKRAINRGLEAIYVEGNTESELLAEVAKRFDLKLTIDMDNSHCPVCNTKLIETSKEQLQSELEKNTFTYYDKFWRCPNCAKIYWRGAHWKRISDTLNDAKAEMQKQIKKNA